MAAVASQKTFLVSTKIQTRSTHQNVRSRSLTTSIAADSDYSRRNMMSLGATFFAAVVITPNAKADLIEDLKAKSDSNKDLRKKQRLATSYANLARSRTVNDGTCAFPYNFAGCEEITNINQGVKFLNDDIKVECEGVSGGKCASKPDFSVFK
eukprot:TRINITY_DN496_c0_g1_i1.p2 TRINITY_DN496_c0_g1~~TRINITY_DN496_c0_g1_i1.p2  ORF type:complete len:177 (-),score=28.72 TRINITY_DN496_c0_g1_i1:152-610(-)